MNWNVESGEQDMLKSPAKPQICINDISKEENPY